jgi:hypothetical protein
MNSQFFALNETIFGLKDGESFTVTGEQLKVPRSRPSCECKILNRNAEDKFETLRCEYMEYDRKYIFTYVSKVQ